jgi:predicted TIM-barrel fold metal-dependent hydrolase
VTEVKRCARELGLRTVHMQTSVQGKHVDHPSFSPLYEVIQDLDLSVGFHVGGGVSGNSIVDRFTDQYALAHACGFTCEAMIATAALACGGVLERFPRLRVAILEAGVGWVPYWLECLDEHYEKRRQEMSSLRMRPSEYLGGDNVYFSCEAEEKGLAWVLEQLGADRLLMASDYPHWDASFTNSVTGIIQRDDLSEEAKDKILSQNAQRYLGCV